MKNVLDFSGTGDELVRSHNLCDLKLGGRILP